MQHCLIYAIYCTAQKLALGDALFKSAVYNNLLKNENLSDRYPLIQDGDKIKFCYMKMPNPIKENVIACHHNLPRQLNLDKYIDYELQYSKSFVEPIKTILDAIGWQVEKRNTLDQFWE